MLGGYFWWYLVPVALAGIGWGLWDHFRGPLKRLVSTDPHFIRTDVLRGITGLDLETAKEQVLRELGTGVHAVDSVDERRWDERLNPFPLKNSYGDGYVVVTLRDEKVATARWSDCAEDPRVFRSKQG
jgi:hypothetical protein